MVERNSVKRDRFKKSGLYKICLIGEGCPLKINFFCKLIVRKINDPREDDSLEIIIFSIDFFLNLRIKGIFIFVILT